MSGKLRTINKFLWLPKKDNKKWYWFKKVTIVEKEIEYTITEWPLIPWGFGGPRVYKTKEWKFVGIVDESNCIEIFIPDKDSPIP